MPSTRSQPLNPRVSAQSPAKRPQSPSSPAAASSGPHRPPVKPGSKAPPDPVRHDDDEEPDTLDKARRAGGFHESSFDLKNGLEVSESEWPPDTTIPGALGER